MELRNCRWSSTSETETPTESCRLNFYSDTRRTCMGVKGTGKKNRYGKNKVEVMKDGRLIDDHRHKTGLPQPCERKKGRLLGVFR